MYLKMLISIQSQPDHKKRVCPDTHSSRLVLAARNTIRPIFTQLEISHSIAMCSFIAIQLFSTLHIKQCNLARLVASEDDTWSIGECADRRF